jgi:hypothetical protein
VLRRYEPCGRGGGSDDEYRAEPQLTERLIMRFG